jgi:hypothetical protein
VKNPTREYNTWVGMKQRCLNPNAHAYDKYGGRGIRVCEQWLSFAGFLADMGSRPEGASLERIDNDGDYQPGNCKWATRKEQARNTRNNHLVTAFGKSRPIIEWAEESGLSKHAIQMRLVKYGWSPEDAVSVPVNARRGTGGASHPGG